MAVPSSPGPHPVTRRLLLGGVLATTAAVAVGAGTSAGRRPATVSSLVAVTPFYIAHRGGGGDWPELTAYAYAQAARLPGLSAFEVSVCLTADGVLVCSHEPNTLAATGVSYVIADQTWSTLSTLMVSARDTRDPGQRPRPFTRFDEVADVYLDRYVLFVEPKDGIASKPLMAKMVALGQPERVVWKQPIDSALFATAKSHGFTTWGYVLDQPQHLGDNLRRLAASPDVDMLGAPRSMPDAFVTAVVEEARLNAKQTIMWEIRSVSDRARALRLGCAGLMTSDIVGVLAAPL